MLNNFCCHVYAQKSLVIYISIGGGVYVCVYVDSFETFGSGSFGGPVVVYNPTGSHSGNDDNSGGPHVNWNDDNDDNEFRKNGLPAFVKNIWHFLARNQLY